MWGLKTLGKLGHHAELDALRTPVMLADADWTITYMNPALLEFIGTDDAHRQGVGAAASRTGSLIGCPVAALATSAPDQQSLLRDLKKSREAHVHYASRAFDLYVSPVAAQRGRATYLIEWTDAAVSAAARDCANKLEAINRSQAVAEFKPDGTILWANANFLKAMGYTLKEVQGRHHSLFVEPEEVGGADYAAFWRQLQAGVHQKAQFKRLGKNRRVVWIEANYSPILDQDGTVTKVVKFSTDVSAQIGLLSELKVLIDRNFAEVASALGRSNREADQATTSAGVTSQNMQSIAAAAVELACTAENIARSMARARIVTDETNRHAQAAGELTEKLADTAGAMNGIVALIQNIANQINLLALNATIESARAGEAGRGFAVVAAEVKNLSSQATSATTRIADDIKKVQTVATQVVEALDKIGSSVGSVRECFVQTTLAVEQQSLVTRDMSVTMQEASSAVGVIASNITGISDAVASVSQAMAATEHAARVLVH